METLKKEYTDAGGDELTGAQLADLAADRKLARECGTLRSKNKRLVKLIEQLSAFVNAANRENS